MSVATQTQSPRLSLKSIFFARNGQRPTNGTAKRVPQQKNGFQAKSTVRASGSAKRQTGATWRLWRYYSSVAILNMATLLLLVYVINPFYFFRQQTGSSFNNIVAAQAVPPPKEELKIISGKPMRVTVPRLGLDLPVDDGVYNPADGSWTLSGYHAHYALITPLANDYGGTTFIYGHNNNHVFGPLKKLTPGDKVQVYTANGHVFSYIFEAVEIVRPDDTKVFYHQGDPLLAIQTCSGNWHELRSLYYFTLEKVE